MPPLLGSILQPVLRVALPHACELCGQETDPWLCPDCLAAFEAQGEDAMCDVCGYPLAGPGDPCPRCLHRPGRLIGRSLRLALHSGAARDLVHRFKFRGRWHLARPLAAAMAARPEIRQLLDDSDLLVPIPLHWLRYVRRGYNQAELLARELGRLSARSVVQLLRRTHEAHAQSTLHSMAARARNVRDAFALRGRHADLSGQRLLLIDDVATTTATLRAAARILRPLRPAQMNALVLTMADPRHRSALGTEV